MTSPLRKVSLTTSILFQMHFIFPQTFHIRASVLISLEMKSLDKLKTKIKQTNKNAYAKFKRSLVCSVSLLRKWQIPNSIDCIFVIIPQASQAHVTCVLFQLTFSQATVETLNYILHMKFSEFYLCFYNSCEIDIHFLGLPCEIFFAVYITDD